jgi:acylphosphatase
MKKQRVHILIRGKVQGVFFRQALKVFAIKNNVYGWVRNLKDNRVEALLEGDSNAVNLIVEWAHHGPANARVDEIKFNNEEFKNEFTSFEVLY